MTKTDKVLHMLQQGSTVTKLTVLPLRVGNLGDIIMRLRNRGHDIRTRTSADEDGHPYTKYELAHRPVILGWLARLRTSSPRRARPRSARRSRRYRWGTHLSTGPPCAPCSAGWVCAR